MRRLDASGKMIARLKAEARLSGRLSGRRWPVQQHLDEKRPIRRSAARVVSRATRTKLQTSATGRKPSVAGSVAIDGVAFTHPPGRVVDSEKWWFRIQRALRYWGSASSSRPLASTTGGALVPRDSPKANRMPCTTHRIKTSRSAHGLHPSRCRSIWPVASPWMQYSSRSSSSGWLVGI